MSIERTKSSLNPRLVGITQQGLGTQAPILPLAILSAGHIELRHILADEVEAVGLASSRIGIALWYSATKQMPPPALPTVKMSTRNQHSLQSMIDTCSLSIPQFSIRKRNSVVKLLKRAASRNSYSAINRKLEKIQQHIHSNVPRAANGLYNLTINGIQFSVINDGTKLERIRGKIRSTWQRRQGYSPFLGPLDPTRPTPKQADVGDVKFFRTANGNLLRNGIAKVKR